MKSYAQLARDELDKRVSENRKLNSRNETARDLKRMYLNLDAMVNEISKLEVMARRKNTYNHIIEKYSQYEEALYRFDQLVLIYRLTI